MNSESDRGIISILLSLILLGFFGVLLSLAVDRISNGNNNQQFMRQELKRNKYLFDELEQQRKDLSDLLTFRQKKYGDIKELHSVKTQSVKQLAGSIDRMEGELDRLTKARKELDTNFRNYVAQYKQSVWAKAVGEQLPYILLKSGEKLDNVIIRGVKPEGLLISNSTGLRLLAPESLPMKMKERFQWDLTGSEENYVLTDP